VPGNVKDSFLSAGFEKVERAGSRFLRPLRSVPPQRLFSACISTSNRSALLIHELQRKLHLARSTRRKDIVECRRTDVAVGQTEVRAVQDVKQLRAELYMR
jgi:hypothetical protein